MDRATHRQAAARRIALLILAALVAIFAACQRDTDVIGEGGSGSGSSPDNDGSGETATAPTSSPSEEALEVTDFGPPAPTVLFVAGIKGYTEPCGCTADNLLGGINRVTAWLQAAAQLAPDAVILDAGNLLFEHDSLAPQDVNQEVRKTEVILAAHREAGTIATVPGPTDLAHGLDFYLEALGSTSMTILASNLTATGELPIGLSHMTRTLGEHRLGIIGAVDPASFAGRDDVETTDPREAVDAALAELGDEVTTTILLFQGDIAAARTAFDGIEGLDFIVIGQPRETDEVETIGSARTMEAFDQGRYIGRLKLYGPAEGESWDNARHGSDEEVARIERIMAGIRARLEQLPANPDGEDPPPIVVRQQERLTGLQAELDAMDADTLDIPDGARAFAFAPVAMEPGYPLNDAITGAMDDYNAELRAINLANVEPVPEVPEGHAGYVGDTECMTCHRPAYDFWQTTEHAHAMATLEDRDKAFDRNCIGCHVTGYQEPGGSVLGNLRGLQNVQCEQCHGPGSLHVSDPTSYVNVEHGVQTEVPETNCTTCHNSEHSPRFDYSTYLPRVLGDGHGG